MMVIGMSKAHWINMPLILLDGVDDVYLLKYNQWVNNIFHYILLSPMNHIITVYIFSTVRHSSSSKNFIPNSFVL
jgi:hypothetical protein